jgi:hypothetical protein
MAGVNIQPNDSTVLTVAVVSATATSAVIAAVTNKIIRVYRLFLIASGTTNLTVATGTASTYTALAGVVPMVANTSMVFDMDGAAWFTGDKGSAIILASDGSGVTVSGALYYTVQPFYG